MSRFWGNQSVARTISLISGSLVVGHATIALFPGAVHASTDYCGLQNQAGNVINLPGMCKPGDGPATSRFITGNRATQCKALMDVTPIKADDGAKINIQMKSEFRLVESDPSQTINSTQIKVTGPSGQPATRAEVAQSILSFVSWVDSEVSRLKGLTFQDAQLQRYRGLIIQFGSQQSQEFRQIANRTNLTPEQMVEAAGQQLVSAFEKTPSWYDSLEQYCQLAEKPKK